MEPSVGSRLAQSEVPVEVPAGDASAGVALLADEEVDGVVLVLNVDRIDVGPRVVVVVGVSYAPPSVSCLE
jgi:hypothetical protein